jgi:RNA polymerase sigma factor (sigma-70 family)
MRKMTGKERALAEDAMRFVPKAIAALCRSYPGIHVQLQRIDAESVAYLAICRAAQTYNADKSRPTTYFSRAIRNAIIKEIAKRRRLLVDGPMRVALADVEMDGHSPAGERVRRAVASMPEELARILRRRYHMGMNLSDIAEAEQCTRSTVRRKLTKALLLFRAAWEIHTGQP